MSSFRSTPSWNAIERTLRDVARLAMTSGLGAAELNVRSVAAIYEAHDLDDLWAEVAAEVVEDHGGEP